MIRRLHLREIHLGDLPLDAAQTHHARDVLRLRDGAEIEAFDDRGNVGGGTLVFRGDAAFVRVVRHGSVALAATFRWSVASAVPKGERADWLVEKLSELGAAEFTPLVTARSVVHPEGKGKRDRWVRLATESAKQCRRRGVMSIGVLTPLEQALQSAAAGRASATDAIGWCLSTDPQVIPAAVALIAPPPAGPFTIFIGPEGGWAADEESRMADVGLRQVSLTRTILRIETAAVAAAALVASFWCEREMPADDGLR